MAEVEQQNIRGLDIDKTVKGFALTNYVFKNAVNTSTTKADHIRWYQETAGDLTATSPSQVSNISPLSNFPTLEESWTRNTSYVKKYGAEGFISMEDQKSADIDVVARTLLRLTRAVIKQVDSDIFDTVTESQSPTNINSVDATATGGDNWDNPSSADPIKDVNKAVRLIQEEGYDASNAELWLSPYDEQSLLNWIISTKGSDLSEFASDQLGNTTLKSIRGLRIRTNKNVASSYAVVSLPKTACTFRQHTSTTSRAIEEQGIGTKYRVYELGVATLTDPKAVTLITKTQA